MDKCGLCSQPAECLYESSKTGLLACGKCQQLIPEISFEEKDTVIEVEADNDTTLHCELCNKTFTKNGQYQAHVRNHRAERRFVCTYCNKAFSQSNNLRAHLRIHTNERPYKCSACGKAFTQVTNLNNHFRLHTGERPFICDEPGCNKAYAQVTNLNQHKKRHLNGRQLETTYDCTICGEQFEQRNHMYNHRRVAHGPNKEIILGPLNCKLCDFKCVAQNTLLEHIATEHYTKESKKQEGELKCVFSSCNARFTCEKQHTDHLVKSHQLRVVSTMPNSEAPKRGRPPKSYNAKTPTYDFRTQDLIEIDINMRDHNYMPKLKVENMFQ